MPHERSMELRSEIGEFFMRAIFINAVDQKVEEIQMEMAEIAGSGSGLCGVLQFFCREPEGSCSASLSGLERVGCAHDRGGCRKLCETSGSVVSEDQGTRSGIHCYFQFVLSGAAFSGKGSAERNFEALRWNFLSCLSFGGGNTFSGTAESGGLRGTYPEHSSTGAPV